MITSQDVHAEVNTLEETIKTLEGQGKPFEAALLKAQSISIKLLLSLRQNQVKDLTLKGVNLKKTVESKNE